jgi:hypothetical protein
VEGDGAAWMVDNPNANGAVKVTAPPPLSGLDTGADVVSKAKPVLLAAIYL